MALSQAQAPRHQQQQLPVQAILWNALGAGSIGYALTELLNNLPADAVDRKLWCLRDDPACPHDYARPVFPEFFFRAFAKVGISAVAQGRIGREVALRHIRRGDVVYLWPPYDLSLIKRAQKRGAIVVAERTNCMASMGRQVLSRAYGRRGMSLPKGWFLQEDIDLEVELMRHCDFVTAANALVATSLTDAGIPQERIIATSYGFDPKRLEQAIGISRLDRPPTYLFVGLGIVRKGLDVLLEAWEKADVAGSLLIAGTIDEEIRQTYSSILARPDVRQLGFVTDIAPVYAAADVFVFPSHEEGGPQVIYEASACALASIVSPMGAGRIVRDGLECLVIDPLDVDDVARAITLLADDADLRHKLSRNAAERAEEFTWAKVGVRLYEQFCALTYPASVVR